MKRDCRCGVASVALAVMASGLVACSRSRPAPPSETEIAARAATALTAALPTEATAPAPLPAPTASAPPPLPSGRDVPAARRTDPALAVVPAPVLGPSPPGVVPSASAAAAPPPTPSASVPFVRTRGLAARGESYEVWLETTSAYEAGLEGSLVVALTAKAPFKCNAQYPYKLALDPPPPGITFPSAVVRGMHVDGKHASMAVPFQAARPGSFSVSGTLSFSTCTVDRCLVDKARVTAAVEVR